MSLTTELQRLHDAKDAIRLSIVRKGVQVPSAAKLDDYADYIIMITGGKMPIPEKLSSLQLDDYGRITSAVYKTSVTTVGENEFLSVKSLVSVSIPNVTSIGTHAFSGSSIASISMPNVTRIDDYAFGGCSSLTSISIPNVTSIGEMTFNGCSSLASVDISSSVTSIGDRAFISCSSLASFTCRGTTPPTLGTHVFTYTSNNLIIYVPAASVDAYKAATNWSAYASKITAIQ